MVYLLQYTSPSSVTWNQLHCYLYQITTVFYLFGCCSFSQLTYTSTTHCNEFYSLMLPCPEFLLLHLSVPYFLIYSYLNSQDMGRMKPNPLSEYSLNGTAPVPQSSWYLFLTHLLSLVKFNKLRHSVKKHTIDNVHNIRLLGVLGRGVSFWIVYYF